MTFETLWGKNWAARSPQIFGKHFLFKGFPLTEFVPVLIFFNIWPIFDLGWPKWPKFNRVNCSLYYMYRYVYQILCQSEDDLSCSAYRQTGFLVSLHHSYKVSDKPETYETATKAVCSYTNIYKTESSIDQSSPYTGTYSRWHNKFSITSFITLNQLTISTCHFHYVLGKVGSG